jgi:hypothetical protein
MKRLISRKAVMVGLTLGLSLGAAGTALAYWTSTGSGTGGAASTDTQGTVTLTQTSTVSGLAPGVAAVDITGTVTNSKHITSYIGTVTPAIDSANTVWQTDGVYTCSAADYTLTPATVNADEADGATGVAFGSIAFNDIPGTDQSACEGQALVLTFSSN